MSKIRVITCQVGYMPRPQWVGSGLDACQQLVGGLIECVNLDAGVDLWLNEEGLILGLPANRIVRDARGVDWPVMGDFYVAGMEYATGETVSLTAEEMAIWLPRLEASPVGAVVPGEEPYPVPDENMHWKDITDGVVRLTNRIIRKPRIYVVTQGGERHTVFWHGQESKAAITYLEEARNA